MLCCVSKKNKIFLYSENGDAESLAKVVARETFSAEYIDNKGRTALAIAAENGHLECVRVLLNAGYDVDRETIGNIGMMEGDESSRNSISSIRDSIQFKKTDKLMNVTTALGLAASRGHKDCVKLLIENGADVKSHGMNVIVIIVCFYGFTECLKHILAAGGNPNAEGSGGNTALIACADGGFVDCVKVLLSSGVSNINQKNESGDNALDCAKKSGHEEVVKLLENLS